MATYTIWSKDKIQLMLPIWECFQEAVVCAVTDPAYRELLLAVTLAEPWFVCDPRVGRELK